MAVDPDVDAAAREARIQALRDRVRHYPPNDAAVVAHGEMRGAVAGLGEHALTVCPLCPELDEALRVLTDVVLAGFNAAIARNHDALPATVSTESPPG